MTYEECLAYIHTRNRFGKKAGLDNMRELLSRMGNPQDSLRFVHVAGTNGKGSVTTMIASVLSEAGYRTGKYISPYILEFRERIQLDGGTISEEDLISCCLFVKEHADAMEAEGRAPVEFEVVTAIAMAWYRRMACDVVVLEVGLGGRCDSTNVIDTPLASVIVSIGLDHTDVLGDTIAKIAAEKSGVIKPGGVTVCYPEQDPEALPVVMEHASRMGNLFVMGNRALAETRDLGLLGTELHYLGVTVRVPLLGDHQILNAVTALDALFVLRDKKGFAISDEAVRNGFEKVSFPARMEVLSKEPLIFLDGAHNPSGILTLCQSLRKLQGRPVTAITGMLRDKDYMTSMKEVIPLCRRAFTVTPDCPRALAAIELAAGIEGLCPEASACESPKEALARALEKLEPDGVLVVFGSLYLAASMREVILNRFPK